MTRLLFRLERGLTPSEQSYFDRELSRYTGITGYELRGNDLTVEVQPEAARIQILGWILAILAALGIAAYFISEIKLPPWELIAGLALIGIAMFALVKYVT